MSSHTPDYPDEPPPLKCRSVKGLFDSELVAVHELLTKHAAESIGMAMIFDLVNEAREWMRTRAGVVDVVEETPEMLKQRLEEEAEARLRAMRATGTPVTPETFNAWVMRVGARAARAKAGKDSAAAAKDDTKRVTGRRYFEERTAAQMAGEEGEEAEDDFEFSDDDFEDSSDDEDRTAFVAFSCGRAPRGREMGEKTQRDPTGTKRTIPSDAAMRRARTGERDGLRGCVDEGTGTRSREWYFQRTITYDNRLFRRLLSLQRRAHRSRARSTRCARAALLGVLVFSEHSARSGDGRLPSRARREAVSSFPSVRVDAVRADDRDVARRRLRASGASRHASSGSRREGDVLIARRTMTRERRATPTPSSPTATRNTSAARPLGTLEDKRRRLREPAVHTVTVEVRLVGFDGDGARAVRLGDRDFAPYLDALRSDVVARILHDDPPAGRDVSRRGSADSLDGVAADDENDASRALPITTRFYFHVTRASPKLNAAVEAAIRDADRVEVRLVRLARRFPRPRVARARASRGGGRRLGPGPPPVLLRVYRVPFSTRTHPAIARTRTRTAPRRSPAGQRGREGQPGCPGQLWVSSERRVWFDLTAGPSSYGPRRGGEGASLGALPRVRAAHADVPSALVPPSWGRFAAHAPISSRRRWNARRPIGGTTPSSSSFA